MLAEPAERLVLHSGVPQAEKAFTFIAVCIGLSIIAHSSMDVPIARAFPLDDLTEIPAPHEEGAVHPNPLTRENHAGAPS
ncbi:hypothetical protein ACWDBF_23235 [Streptomyces angustmyceticus]